MLGEDQAKLKQIFDIRWLSMGEAVRALLRNYKSLLTFTDEQGAAGDPTAIGVHQQLRSYLYAALLHLAADVLDTTNHLSKLFQYRDVCFSALRSQVF